MMHFSMRPSTNFKEKIRIGKFVLNYLFTKWLNPETKKPYLASVFGLTPHTNRAAIVIARKAGFKVLGILPKGVQSEGTAVDAVISVASL